MLVHTGLLGLLWRLLESYDVDPAELIPASTYRPGRYMAERSYTPTREFYPIVLAMIARVGDEAIGVRAANLVHPSHLGILGHAWVAGPSLLANFRMLCSYSKTFHYEFRVEVVESTGSVKLIFDPHSFSPYADVDADAQVGGVIRLCRMQIGDSFAPLAVSLRRAEPRDRRPWDEFFGTAVLFGAQENSFTVDGPTARRNLPTANAGLFDFHQGALQKTIVDLDDSDIVGRVRQAIRQLLPSAGVTEERVASVVDLNVRTLHRRLSAEGQNFRTLLKDVRMSLAQRYLGEEKYSLTEVAFMLGYSDSSAFSRAFKGWYGDTPSSYRLKES